MAVRVKIPWRPAVTGFLNFGWLDEDRLGGWQGRTPLGDRTRKTAYDAFRLVIAEVRSRDTDCSTVRRPRGADRTPR
jgi:hypothetical protein